MINSVNNAHGANIVNFYYECKQDFPMRSFYDSAMNEDAINLAANLARLMKYHGDDQVSLEKKSGVAQKTISNILNMRAKKGTNLGIVADIAKTYKIKTWHLLLAECPDEILFNHRIEKLVENFLNSDEIGRNATMAVSETRAHYHSEKQTELKNAVPKV